MRLVSLPRFHFRAFSPAGSLPFLALALLLPLVTLAEEAETNPFTVSVNSYLGGTGDFDAVTGAEIQSDGTIVLVAIISNAQPGGIAPILVNGATTESGAAILRLSSDGRTLISVTRTGEELFDVSLDADDNIYVAAGYDGLLKLNPSADTVLFQRKAGTFIARVDAARNGDVAILAPINYGPDMADGRRREHNNAGASWIHAYDANGDLITEFQTLGGRNNVDVAIWDGDGNREDARIVYIGWRQAWAWTGVFGGCGDPFVRATQGLHVTVHIGLMYGVTYDYDGTNPEEIAYRIYDRVARPEDIWLPGTPEDLKLRRQEHVNPRFFNGPVNVTALYTEADIEAARNDGQLWTDWLWLEYDAGNSYVGAAKNIIYPEAHAWYMQGIPEHPDFQHEDFRPPGWCPNFTSTQHIGLPYTAGNNMADTRGQRVAIGRDGKLYGLWESAGGNTEVRWDPFDITRFVPKPGADLYHQFLNIASAHAITFVRYDPVTGDALLRQEFAPNFVNSIGATISNTVRAKGADITADETGRVFVTGAAGGQMPIPLADNYSGVTGFNPYPDGSYMGGAYLLVMSPDMGRREYATRLTPEGWGHAVAARIIGDPEENAPIIVYGGRDNLLEPLWLRNALQPYPGYGVQDGFFAVFGGDGLGADQYQLGWGLNNRTQSGRSWFRGVVPSSSAIDADGDGNVDDAVSGWAFSDTVPLSPPAPAYTGIPYYGGAEAVRLNSGTGNFWNQSRTGHAGNFTEGGAWRYDGIEMNPLNAYRSTMLIYFDKKDFPGVSADDRLSFSSATRQRVSYVTDRSWWASRWVVRDGDTFYVSEAMAIEDRNRANSGGLSFSDDFDHGRWAVYDPASSLYFDATTAVFASRTFTNITGFGVINNIISANGENNAGIMGVLRELTMQFEVNHVASRNPTAVIHQELTYANPNQSVLLDGTASTDPDGVVTFYTWQQRNDANTSLAGPVVAVSYSAPGNYRPVLRVYDDQLQEDEATTRIWVGPDPALGANPARVVAAYSGDKGVTNLRGRNFIEGGLDLNGNGEFTDTRRGAVFSETNPVENRIGSTRLFGGIMAQFMGTDDPRINRWEWRERFWVELQGGESRPANFHGALFIDKSDFLNDGEFGTVAFANGDYIEIRVDENPTQWPLRWLVREGSNYYVSETTFSAQNTNHRYTFSGANDGQWAPYDPATNMDFDAAGATFAPMTFNNVTALGFVIDSDNVTTAFQRLRVRHIFAEATITPPASTPPTPSFTWTPTAAEAGQTVTFDATASSDDYGITTVRWQFEDGTFAQSSGTLEEPPEMTTDKQFFAPGSHSVTLILTNILGLSSVLTQEITITGDPITRARVTATPTSGINPLVVAFDASASTAATGRTITNYAWNFGDGTVLLNGGPAPTHTFTATGSYNVTLTITDSEGQSSSASTWISVAVAPSAQPTAAFTMTPETGKNPLTITLDASASTPGSGNIVNYIWNFSDGTTASGMVTQKTFAEHGTYTIFLSVLNTESKVASTQSDIVVIENLHPVANLSASVSEGTLPLVVQFDASGSFDPDGSIVRYDWDFGDGTILDDGGATPSHTYTTEGTFVATVTVTDDNTATDEASVTLRTVEFGAAQLVYRYTFDGGSGSSVADVSGFGDAAEATMFVWNDATDLRATAHPSPQGLEYADFAAGGRRHLSVPQAKWNSTIAGAEGSAGFTVSMLLRDLEPRSGGQVRDRAFFRHNAGQSSVGLFNAASTDASALPLILRLNGTTDIPLGANANLSNATTGDSNGWVLLTFTYDASTNSARVFVARDYNAAAELWTDVTQVGSNVTINATTLNTVGHDLAFGTASAESPRALFDDLRIYDRALLPAEISAIMTAVEGPPVFVQQPQSQVVAAGSTVTFAVTAIANPEPQFQWFFNSAPIDGATHATLALTDVTAADAGSYFVRASNSFGHVDSDPATLTVVLPPPAPSGLVSTFVAPTSVGLSWTDNSAGTATFEVRLANGIVVATAEAGETSVTVTDLNPDTSYTFTVRAVNMAGPGSDSNSVTVRTDFLVMHTVSFAANGGSGAVPDNETVILGELFTVPGAGSLSREGFVFNGWRDNLGAVTYSAGDTFAMPAADVELSAQWTVLGDPGSYLQRFNTTTNQLLVENAGIGWQRAAHDGNLGADQVGRLSDANGPDGQAGFAYTFRGNNNATLMWYEGLTLSQDTLQAFSAYVGHGHANNLIRFLIRIGDNWYASADGGGKAPTTGNAAWFENGATQYTVNFSPESSWVQVVGFNGTPTGTFTLLAGGNLTPLAALPAGDVTAVGVYLANLSGSVTRFDDFTVTWAAPGSGHTVTYTANGGTGDVPVDDNLYAPATTITVMGQGSLTRDGHTFLGWRDEVAGETYAPLATFAMPERDVTLAAQWTQSATDAYGDWVAANNITGSLIDLTNGVPNLIRYALGGDATTPISQLTPQLQSQADPGGLTLSLTFHRVNDPEVTYAVWFSEDLVDWHLQWQGTGAHDGVPGAFEVSAPTPGNRGFLRLEVTR
jgi:uncharacterized repeat protein (TIGR02543 family)